MKGSEEKGLERINRGRVRGLRRVPVSNTRCIVLLTGVCCSPSFRFLLRRLCVASHPCDQASGTLTGRV